MAEQDMSSIIGRKIFFIAPTPTIKNYVVSALRDDELEVYVIDNCKMVKNVLAKNPGSICFFNLDSGLSLMGWFILLEDLSNDESLGDMVIGLISDRLDDSEKAYVQQHAKINGGIHKIGNTPLKLLDAIRGIAESEHAKGRRQYVRANCFSENLHELMWNQDNTIIKLKLADISTSGAAVKVQQKFLPLIQEKSKIRGATLRLGTRQFLIDFIVYGIHQRGPNTLMITIFQQETIRVLHDDLQNYIYEILQKHMAEEMELLALDEKEYNKLGKQIKIPKLTVDPKAEKK
ncbi:MAG: hypothetical protein II584_04480 [Treponema sp.]|nr:hypothetical protein [Treponema sp.]